MTETDHLKAEIAELREAVLQLAHIENQNRWHFFNLPRGSDLAQNPDEILMSVLGLLYGIGSLPENTPNIQGASWVDALHKRAGVSFDQFRAKFRAKVDKEADERVARRKAAA
jgi:hypothetical protein